MRKTFTAFLLGLCLTATAQTDGKSLKDMAGAVADRVKVTGYAQAGYTARTSDDYNSAEMYRAILMAGVDITPQFYAFFMHDFKSGDMQEYYMEWRPSTALRFRFGQSKIEYSMENPMSPTVLESIAPMSQGVFWLCGYDPLIGNPAGRDLGLMVYGDLFGGRLRYVLEAVNGSRTNAKDPDTQKNIIAKLEYKIAPNFRLSVSGQKGYNTAFAASAYNPRIAVGERYVQDRYAGGFEWKSKIAGTDYNRHRCATVRAEMLGGRDGDCHSFGGYMSAAVPVYRQLDIVAMADYFEYNTDLKARKAIVMGGVQYWIAKKCRLQVQYSFNKLSQSMGNIQNSKCNYSLIQAQAQVAF